MNIAVLGSGMVGAAIASKLVSLGHAVKMGSRTPNNEKAGAWVAAAGNGASQGTFQDAARFGELVFNCTSGARSLEALAAAGAASLEGKLLVDVSNPLDFSKGMPPTLFTGSGESLAERIQAAFPESKVVKTLNTVNCQLMVEPSRVKGEHDMFVCGNDAGAKAQATKILKEWFGWQSVLDLGDLSAARGSEGYVLLWVRLWGSLGTADFNLKIVR